MLAYVDYSIPKLFSEKSVMLLLAFGVMAFFVSPFSHLDRRVQERVVACYLPAIFAWWFLFQFQLVSLNPHVHYYLGRSGRFSWMMNSGICYAFGLAFSVRLLRLSRGWLRVEGGAFTAIYALMIFAGEALRPAMMST
jgi:hypothetical protein